MQLILVDVVFASPIKRRVVNSLYRFSHEHVSFDQRAASQSESGMRRRWSRSVSEGLRETASGLQTMASDMANTVLHRTRNVAKHQRGAHFVYMREFRRRYEEYCIVHNLEPVTNRDDIVRSLVQWHHTRVNLDKVFRLKGVRWLDDSDATPANLSLRGTAKTPARWYDNPSSDADISQGDADSFRSHLVGRAVLMTLGVGRLVAPVVTSW